MEKKHGHETQLCGDCGHCLHACEHCDVAYCCDCNREWGTCRQTHYWYFKQYTPTNIKPYWGSTTITDVTTSTTPLELCAHGHEN